MSRLLKVFDIFQPTDYTISTWLLLGATVQCLLVVALPRNLAFLPPIAFLAYRILRGYLVATGCISNELTRDVAHGRRTWQIPSTNNITDSTDSSDSIVVFVLAASWNHPNGRFSPGTADLGGYFMEMWDDAESNREKYGFLGNTPSMAVEGAGKRPDGRGRTVVYLSYWKSLEGLNRFAHAAVHMKGQLWWEKGAMDKFPHIGIMHETYEVPAGNWENVFHNFRPFGISKAKYPLPAKLQNQDEKDQKNSVDWVSGLQSAGRKEWKTMLSRMGRRV